MIEARYKDRLFCFIFGSEDHKDWTLSLYNAVNGTAYTDPELITLTTLEGVLYMGMHNDVGFLIADEINMYEQQSQNLAAAGSQLSSLGAGMMGKDLFGKKST